MQEYYKKKTIKFKYFKLIKIENKNYHIKVNRNFNVKEELKKIRIEHKLAIQKIKMNCRLEIKKIMNKKEIQKRKKRR